MKSRITKRVYIAGPIDGDYAAAAVALADHDIDSVYRLVKVGDHQELARAISEMTGQCDAICLLDAWWSSREANCLQLIASWLRYTVYDEHAHRVATKGLNG